MHGTYVFYCVFQLIPQLSIQELYYRRQDRGNSDKIEKLLGRTQEHCVSVCAVRDCLQSRGTEQVHYDGIHGAPAGRARRRDSPVTGLRVGARRTHC